MKKTIVLNVVGLTPGLLGEHTPFLSQWSKGGGRAVVQPVVPAVTCSAQSTYLTGQWPDAHGIVGNGWYFRDTCEIRFWHQSNKLVEGAKVWDVAKQRDPVFTCANMFWWYNMHTTADFSVTPRPQYLADGRKMPDCYSHPADLRDHLQAKFGTFPLFEFWGPRTSIRSSQWIADAAMEVDRLHNPTLTLVYLPHLDYNLQRLGPNDPKIGKDLREIDGVCQQVIKFYEGRGAQVIVLSEYGITAVDRPVALNRTLREHGYLATREERGTELLDAGASEAFAVADHQVAHVYVKNPARIAEVKALIAGVPGVERTLAGEERREVHLAHARAGEIVAIADARSWFSYYYWLDDQRAPDFARVVDIHKKPGYDPVEMLADPTIRFLMPKVALKLLRKRLGFRMLMDIIPLDASLIRGSHGRVPDAQSEYPLLMTRSAALLPAEVIQPTDVFDVILAHLGVEKPVSVER